MGGCTYFPFLPRMGFFGGGVVSILLWGLIIAGVIYLVMRLTRLSGSNRNTPQRDTTDSLEIAKKRYAKGEITQEEYTQMKKVLLQ